MSSPNDSSPPSLSYRLGLAVLRGVPAADAPAWLTHDPRLDALVAPGHRLVELRRLMGPVVYRRTIGEMTDAELARFAVTRRYVGLSSAEEARYTALTGTYESHMERAGYRERGETPSDAWRIFASAARRSHDDVVRFTVRARPRAAAGDAKGGAQGKEQRGAKSDTQGGALDSLTSAAGMEHVVWFTDRPRASEVMRAAERWARG